MTTFLVSWVLVLVAAVVGAYRWFKRISFKHIAGPVDEATFWCGNLPDLLNKEVGETEFKWQEKYGGIVRFKGPLLEDRLWVCDPKAMQYILQTSGYRWPKPRERRAASYMLVGNAVTFAEGNDHKRFRKIMQPGFGVPETKALLPWFNSAACSITSHWKDLISMNETQCEVFNLHNWLSRGALDAFGSGALDYQFNAVSDEKDPLCQAISKLISG